ncbi:hypothetical protein ACFLU4_02220 [Chloroflexota bacterium]
MSITAEEENKLAAIATDMGLAADMRVKAIEQLGRIGSRESLLLLLEMAGNEAMVTKERDIALMQARKIIKQNR